MPKIESRSSGKSLRRRLYYDMGLRKIESRAIFLNGQFIIVYTCKPHIHKYSLVIITRRIFSSRKIVTQYLRPLRQMETRLIVAGLEFP